MTLYWEYFTLFSTWYTPRWYIKSKTIFANETQQLQQKSCSRPTPDFKSGRHCPIHWEKAPTSLRPFCFDFIEINNTAATYSHDLSSHTVYFIIAFEQVPENDHSSRPTFISFHHVWIVSGCVRGFVDAGRYLVKWESKSDQFIILTLKQIPATFLLSESRNSTKFEAYINHCLIYIAKK